MKKVGIFVNGKFVNRIRHEYKDGLRIKTLYFNNEELVYYTLYEYFEGDLSYIKYFDKDDKPFECKTEDGKLYSEITYFFVKDENGDEKRVIFYCNKNGEVVKEI